MAITVPVTTSFLLDCNGIAVADKSGKTLTLFGDTVLSKTIPKWGSGGSLQFTGAGSYLETGDHADFNFGVSDFTLEFWMYQTTSAAATVLSKGSFGPFQITIGATAGLDTSTSGTAWDKSVVGLSMPIGSWVHIAAVRSAGTLNVYVAGVGVQSIAVTGALTTNASNLRIGGFTGYLANLRITKGVARYTANFVPDASRYSTDLVVKDPYNDLNVVNLGTEGNWPFDYARISTPNDLDPYSANTVLLAHFDSMSDSSGTGKTITAQGSASLGATAKFGATALYSGAATNSSVSVTPVTDFNFGTGDFTLECWAYTASINATYTRLIWITHTNGVVAINTVDGGAGNAYAVTSNNVAWSGVYDNRPTAKSVYNGAWHHFAYCRLAGVSRFFVDGVAQTMFSNLGGTNNGTAWADTTNITGVTSVLIGGDGTYNYNGYIDEVRITKAARYTSNFPVQTVAYPDPSSSLDVADPLYTNVSLLLNFKGSTGTVYVRDQSAPPSKVYFQGNAQQTQTKKNLSNSSLLLDGAGDYLAVSDATKLRLSGSLHTWDMWVAFAVLPVASARMVIVQKGDTSTSDLEFSFYILNTAGVYSLVLGTSSNGTAVTNTVSQNITTPTLNQWYHWAWTLNGTVVTFFIGGVVSTTGADVTKWFSGTGTLAIGASPTGANGVNGYLDAIRLTKGVCRYTVAFTPDTSLSREPNGSVSVIGNAALDSGQFKTGAQSLSMRGNNTDPSWASVVLQMSMDLDGGAFIGDQTGKTVTANGGCFPSQTRLKYGNASLPLTISGAYLSLAASTAWALSTNYTIEFYVNLNAYTTSGRILAAGGGTAAWNATTGYHWCFIGVAAVGGIWQWWNGTAMVSSSNIVMNLNQWYHVALTYDGISVRTFLDGVLQQTIASVITAPTTTPILHIGSIPPETGTLIGNCYVDDLRITKGVCRYTTTFPPPTELQRANLGNWVAIPYSFAHALGSYDFTIEGYVRLAAYPLVGQPAAIATQGWTNGNVGPWLLYCTATTGEIRFYASSNGTGWDIASAVTMVIPNLNQWYHLAVCRANGALQLFVDGVVVATIGGVTPALVPDITPITIGGSQNPNTTFPGWVDSFRITKGLARYTATFTPPTSEFPTVLGVTDANYSAVSLLLKDSLVDYSPTVKTLVNTGASAVTVTGPNNGGSLKFDGAGDYASVPASADWGFGGSDFTIEAWVYLTVLPASGSSFLVCSRSWDLVPANQDFYLGINNTGGTAYVSAGLNNTNGTGYVATCIISSPLNRWVHVGVQRRGNTWGAFADGVLSATVTMVGAQKTVNTASNPLLIGCGNPSGVNPWFFNGYIADLRITKGIARYLQSFQPPVRQTPTLLSGTSYGYTNLALSGKLYRLTRATTWSQGKYSVANGNWGWQGGHLQASYQQKSLWGRPQFQGNGRIRGTVKQKGVPINTPLARKVVLLENENLGIIQVAWSDPVTGAYSFDYVPNNRRYTVIVYDYLGNYRAVIADAQIPEIIA
jgi:hypothetical protein